MKNGLAVLSVAFFVNACQPASGNAVPAPDVGAHGVGAGGPSGGTGSVGKESSPNQGSTGPDASPSPSPKLAAAGTLDGTASLGPAAANLASASAPSPTAVDALIAADVPNLGNAKSTTVYATINHLEKNATGTQDLDVIRFGLSKALNSISTQSAIVPLQPIDPAATVFRIDLASYGLNSAAWQALTGNQYAAKNTTQVAGVPVVKGDWLVYAATRPEIYDAIFALPPLISMLQATLGVNQTSGGTFINVTNSDVVFNNRVLQRLPMGNGGYFWRSYDFAIQATAAKAFGNPQWVAGLGLQDSITNLVAGEFIYSLPNGLQAYMLTGFGTQHRYDVPGPSGDIDPPVGTDYRRPQDKLSSCVGGKPVCGFVINGESCMGCHAKGPNSPKTIVGTTAGSTSAASDLLAQDQARFTAALAAMNYPNISEEPIEATVAAFRAYNNISDLRKQSGDTDAVGLSGQGGL